MSRFERKQRVTQDHDLPITRQCELFALSRSSAYYQPAAISEEELSVMRKLDALHLRYPFYGSRRLRDILYDEHDITVNRKRIQRLMRKMGIHTIYPGKDKRTTVKNRQHPVYPYLLRDLEITHSNQVWCSDITYRVPGAQGKHGCLNEPRVYLKYIEVAA